MEKFLSEDLALKIISYTCCLNNDGKSDSYLCKKCMIVNLDNIDLNENFLTLLFKYIYQFSKLDAVTYKDRIFYNKDTTSDDDDDDDDDNLLNEKQQPKHQKCFDLVERDKQKFVISTTKSDKLEKFVEHWCDTVISEKEYEFITTLDEMQVVPGNKEKIVFISSKDIWLHNHSGFNDDKRGSNRTDICLKYHEKVCLTKKFTYGDLLEKLFEIKSHKFDLWYELFCDANAVVTDKKITINMHFDHGS